MRLAILADIHGNLPAFEAALAHAQDQRPDQIIIAGDIVVGCPDSATCWQKAAALGVPILRGNHERYLVEFSAAQETDEQFAPIRWAVRQVTEADRLAMKALPFSLVLPEFPDTLFVHGSLRQDRDNIAAHTPEAELHAMFPGLTQRWIVRAHNHCCMIRQWGERTIVTAGSVGLPLDVYTTAQYLILDRKNGGWDLQHQSVQYDVETSLRRFEETGYLKAAGPMTRLFRRELMTASYQVVPFIRWYDELRKREKISLADAVDRFLNF